MFFFSNQKDLRGSFSLAWNNANFVYFANFENEKIINFALNSRRMSAVEYSGRHPKVLHFYNVRKRTCGIVQLTIPFIKLKTNIYVKKTFWDRLHVNM